MSLTVGELLQLEGLKGSVLLAGEAGLGREVSWVNIQEVLDCLDILRPGELLITTGFGLQADVNLQDTLIATLAGLNLAGLAVQTGFYLHTIPQKLLEQAEYYSLPLIELPRHASFRSLTEEILKHIIDRQNQLLEYGEKIQNLMTEAAMQNSDLSEIAAVLTEILNRDVGIQTMAVQAPRTWDPKAKHIKDPDRGSVLAPIWAGDKVFGYLSVQENSAPLTPRELAALERTAIICSFVVLKEQAALNAELKFREDFFSDLLAGGFTEEVMLKRGKLMGYDLSGPQTVVELEWEDSKPEIPSAINLKLEQFFAGLSVHYLIKQGNKTLTLLIGTADEDRKLIRGLHLKLLSITTPLHCGVSLPTQSLSEIKQRQGEALEALRLARAIGSREFTAYFSELGIYRLLFRLKDTPELQEFYSATTRPLYEYDSLHHSQLLKTLEVYLSCGQNGLETSKALYIHRHTLTYRLGRIRQLTGLNPADLDHALRLQLGLMAGKLLTD